MRKISAYVQQEDCFIGDLTVRETIVFAANLRMGQKYSHKEKLQRVEKVISQMGLTSCQYTRIGSRFHKSISRGEKKRLAFACEILTNPPILFCDEPTSGLDAFMAKQVVAVMKKLALDGMTVISTIHQPSSQVFELADSLILMANGKTAYHGPADEVIEFFSSAGFPMVNKFVNPADHFMRVLSRSEGETEDQHGSRIEAITQKYVTSSYGETVGNFTHNSFEVSNTERRRMREDYSALNQYKTSFRWQVWILFYRALRCVIRNPMILNVRLFQVMICAITIGAVYLQTPLRYNTIQNYVGVMFNNVRDMNFMFVFPCIMVFTSDLPVIIREYKSNMYLPAAYFIGKNLADTVQYLVFPFIYSVIIFFMTFRLSDLDAAGEYTSWKKFGKYVLVNTCMATTSTSVGYAAACICGNLEIATQLVPLVVVPLLVLGGLFINLWTVPLYFRWIEYISYYRYAFEAHMNNFFSDITHIEGCTNATDKYCHQIHLDPEVRKAAIDAVGHGPNLMVSMKMRPDVFWIDIGFLLGITLVLRLIAVIALHIRVTRR
ncbi:unnamed protein product, partial [Mesorhabditis spiculigera]